MKSLFDKLQDEKAGIEKAKAAQKRAEEYQKEKRDAKNRYNLISSSFSGIVGCAIIGLFVGLYQGCHFNPGNINENPSENWSVIPNYIFGFAIFGFFLGLIIYMVTKKK